ncbi:MAG: cytochrome c biogenesis protein [Candidatus Micrarchaeota archaeon]
MNIKKILIAIVLIVAAAAALSLYLNSAPSQQPCPVGNNTGNYTIDVYLFERPGCGGCVYFYQKLPEIRQKFPGINLTEVDVSAGNGSQIFVDFAEAYNKSINSLGTPTIAVNDKLISEHYVDDTIAKLKAEMTACGNSKNCVNPYAFVYNHTGASNNGNETCGPGANLLSLPVVLGAAAVDAINPCEWAVLILLLSTVIVNEDRKKGLLAGLAFSAAVYITYLAMGIGIFKAIEISGARELLFSVIGVFAIIVGLLNIKDYFKQGAGGFEMAVPKSWRPRMKGLIRKVVSVPGAFLTGILVSFFLLPCTSGPYIVILSMLAQQGTLMQGLSWLLLYNFIFILPMIAITLIVYKGLTTTEKAQAWRLEKVKYMHLFAGILMVAIGLWVLLFM